MEAKGEMMRSVLRWCVVPLLASTLVAQTAAKPKPKKPVARHAAVTAADVQARGEDFIQKGTFDRNRARLRVRFGFDGKLNEDFTSGIYLATGSLGDPTTTNETLTNFFDRKTIALDKAWITYNPIAHKWVS